MEKHEMSILTYALKRHNFMGGGGGGGRISKTSIRFKMFIKYSNLTGK